MKSVQLIQDNHLVVAFVYRYQKSIQYVSSIHCFDTRYVLSILICSIYQDNKVPVLMTCPPEPHFKCVQPCKILVWCKIALRVHLERNGWIFLVKNIKFFLFWPNLGMRKVERYDIDILASTISVIVS